MKRCTPTLLGAALAFGCVVLPAEAEHSSGGSLQLPGASRVGVINLVDAEVTHFHAAPHLENSYLKTYTLSWQVGPMLVDSVRTGLTQRGLVVVPLAPSDELARARERCFLNATLSRGLPRDCVPLFAHLAGNARLSAIIVLGPGRNDSAHAGSARHKELPDYLRGFSFVTSDASGDSLPLLLDLTELLLVRTDPEGAELIDREWGGNGSTWTGYHAPPDLKAIPTVQLDQLQGLYATMLQRQADTLLTHLQGTR
jgi:hypothetical protein